MLEQRNLIIAIAFSVAILVGWQFLLPKPPAPAPVAQSGTAAPSQSDQVRVPGAPSTLARENPGAPAIRDRGEVVKDVPRVRIESPRVSGSVSLLGARIDDLILKSYRTDIDLDSPPVTFLSPLQTTNPYYAQFGWTSAEEVALPDDSSLWQSRDTVLSPDRPITMEWDNGAGLRFFRTISIDSGYMFTLSDRIENYGTNSVTLVPFGVIVRKGRPETENFFILHEGALGVFDEVLDQEDYDDIIDADNGRIENTPKIAGGWIGITDKYWLTALIPDQASKASFSYNHWPDNGRDNFQVDFHRTEGLQISGGGTATVSNRVFAGAKVVRLLDGYKNNLGIAGFDRAVDFGLMFFLTKPMFLLLRFLSETIGNFGIAILLVTVMVKLVFFPLANRSYRAMSKMKLLAPEMTKIKERFKDDRQRQQQEMMALYKREGANPVSGCLPIFVQIPVFFALYKVLFVTIEMRHTPFFSWIQDLSAADPLNLFTGFGLIPVSLPEIIPVIGIWPILMGLSMWLQQRLNPQPMDKMQARIFMLLPIVFTFILAPFPAGLVIYWTWNNMLSIAQQWVIMRRAGIKNPAAAE
ncbi:MAG: membrane protein insertase YidC [Proteobacteria bacterium]|nr:membrane protein insertase YidC [Pseudomonadota bacterium]MDA1058485.1 membrane protein insertase YidC [Pseudomonadota bacterium]